MQTPKGEINDKVMELIKDEAILAEMAKASSPEACYEIVKDRIGISFEEFRASMSVAKSFVADSGSDELSEDELDAVAGGKASKSPVFAPQIKPAISDTVLAAVA